MMTAWSQLYTSFSVSPISSIAFLNGSLMWLRARSVYTTENSCSGDGASA